MWACPGGATLVNHVVIREQKKRGKGYLITHHRCPRGLRLGYQFHEILGKREYFSAVSYRHLMYEFQRHEISATFATILQTFVTFLSHFPIKNGTFPGIMTVIAVGQ